MNNIPAFPVRSRWDPGSGIYDLEDPGMTLLDWFAGQFLNGVCSVLANSEIRSMNKDKIVKDCYNYAAAMIKERENWMKELK